MCKDAGGEAAEALASFRKRRRESTRTSAEFKESHLELPAELEGAAGVQSEGTATSTSR